MADLLKYRAVTGLFTARVNDATDADHNPDLRNLHGDVVFTPNYQGGLIAFPSLGEFVRPEPIYAVIVDGRMMTRESGSDPAVYQPLNLVVTEDDRASQSWTWTLEYTSVFIDGDPEPLSIPSMTFTVPDEAGDFNLPGAVGVRRGGTITVQGPPGPGIQSIYGEDGSIVFVLENGVTTSVPMPDAVPGPQGPPGSIDNLEEQLETLVPPLINDLAENALQLKCVYLENGTWCWSTDQAIATHYVLPDHNGVPTVRATPFPVPSSSAMEFEW